uniref:Pitrilysin metalloproteinase 1 n=1 Tax=Oryzias sinensis TaxID=183150 RepID=A0A8C7YSH8_9TELE
MHTRHCFFISFLVYYSTPLLPEYINAIVFIYRKRDFFLSLIYKSGVLFFQSDNERLFAQHLQNKLLPDHTYSVVSGGEPLAIPDLTWEQLKQFHATHYHPSNARFFTYGDLPLENHLKQIHEEALSKFERIDPKTEVPSQPHWTSPREDHVTCSPDALAPDQTKQNSLCVSYLLGDITDTFEGFTLSLLSSLMVSGPNSPFYKSLIEPKIGSDFSSVVGTKEGSFSIGLQGMAEQDTEKVKQIISQTIDHIIETGFEEERIEALLHKIEIQIKHQSTNFGLSLASYIASSWNHDGDPVELLRISESVARFRQALKENPRFLQDKVKLYFKENTHRLTLSMSPDHDYTEKQATAEDQKLQQKVQALTDKDREKIYQKGLELLAAQSQTQDASCLPALKVSDIHFLTFTAGVPVQLCEQPTNGLVYFRAMCSLNTLPEDLRLYVPLFCSVLTKMGCGALDYRQQAQQMELRTGGMSASAQVVPDSAHIDTFEQGILLSSSCLERNLPHMFHLWSDIFNSPHFENEERLRVLVTMAAQELANGISYSGHMYAMTRAGRHLTPAGDLQETFAGMEQVWDTILFPLPFDGRSVAFVSLKFEVLLFEHQVKFVKRIAEMPDLSHVIRTLVRIKRHLLNPDNMRPVLLLIHQMQFGHQIHVWRRFKFAALPVQKCVSKADAPATCGRFIVG